jgi:hypothetical protein
MERMMQILYGEGEEEGQQSHFSRDLEPIALPTEKIRARLPGRDDSFLFFSARILAHETIIADSRVFSTVPKTDGSPGARAGILCIQKEQVFVSRCGCSLEKGMLRQCLSPAIRENESRHEPSLFAIDLEVPKILEVVCDC